MKPLFNVLMLSLLALTSCSKANKSVSGLIGKPPPGDSGTIPEDDGGNQEEEPPIIEPPIIEPPTENPEDLAENASLLHGIWHMLTATKCGDICQAIPSKIPVKERDSLQIHSIKARGITVNKYKNNPWLYLTFTTGHPDYFNQKIKLCFQNEFKVMQGTDYLNYISKDHLEGDDLNIVVVVDANKTCSHWYGKKSKEEPIMFLYQKKKWVENGLKELDQFLLIGEENDVVEARLTDSFEDSKAHKKISSESNIEIEVK